MTKNPILNALTALGYIILVATVMFYGIRNISHEKDTVLIPIAMLSLFSLSAAISEKDKECQMLFKMPLVSAWINSTLILKVIAKNSEFLPFIRFT